MDSDNKNIKDMFSHENAKVPTELQWDTMESGILEKMDRIQAEEASNQKKQRKRVLILLGLLLLIMTPFVCSELKTDANPNEFVTKVAVSESSRDTDQAVTTPAPTQDIKGAINDRSATMPNQVASNLVGEKQRTKSTNNGKSSLSALNSTSTTNSVRNPSSNQTPLTGAIENNPQIDREFISANMLDSDKKVEAIESSDNFSESSQNTLTLRSEEMVVGIVTRRFLPAFQTPLTFMPNFIFPEKQAIELPSHRWMMSAGPALWSFGYGDDLPERASFEKNVLSFQTQLAYIAPIKNNFQWMVGLQYLQMESRLNWSTVIDDYSVLLEDVVLEVQTNSLTGSQSEVIGDVEVEVEANRRVQHYNTSRMIQIPIAIGKTWSSGKWQSDLFVGSSLNVYSNNTGRTLFNNEIVNYTGNKNPIYSNQIGINGFVAARISYRIAQHWSLSSGIQFQKSISNWSNETGITMRPQIINWDLGLLYRL